MSLLSLLRKTCPFRTGEMEGKNRAWGRPQRGISLKVVVLGVMGLLLFLTASIWGRRGVEGPEAQLPEAGIRVKEPVAEGKLTVLQQYEEFLSSRLASILTEVQGAGEVAVYVSLASGPEYDYAQNRSVEARTTEERDTGRAEGHSGNEGRQPAGHGCRQSGEREPGLVHKELHPPVQGC